MAKTRGYVYILTNPSFREDWVKIWKSSRPVNVRSKELDNTSVPLPFHIYATLQTEKYELIEKQMHKILERLAGKRIRKEREFFNILPAEALVYLADYAELIDDAEILWPDFYKWVKDDDSVQIAPTKTPIVREISNGSKIINRASKSKVDENKIENIVFHHKRSRIDAKLIVKNNKFIVKKGSYVSPDITSNIETIKKLREIHKNAIINNRTNSDLEFLTPSSASQFVCWTSSNWRSDWIDDNDIVLDKYKN